MLKQDQIQNVIESTLTDLESLMNRLQVVKSSILDVVSSINYHYGSYYLDYRDLYLDLLDVEEKIVVVMFQVFRMMNDLKNQKSINTTK